MQKAIARKAVDKKGDSVLAMKGNHPLAHEEIKKFMDNFSEHNKAGYATIEKGHGRLEIRKYWQRTDIDWFAGKAEWKSLKSFCMVEATRTTKEKTTNSRRYYISSLGKEREKKAVSAIREHWQTENALHWRLDVIFDHYKSRSKTRNTAKNHGTLRAMTINLSRKITGKGSIKRKRFKASLFIDRFMEAMRI